MTFPEHLITEPILYTVTKEHDIIPNIRRAKVSETEGEIVLDLLGESANLDLAVARFSDLGVDIESLSGDSIEE